MTGTELDLPSEFLLMATRDDQGTLKGWHHYGLAGAVLMELALQERLQIKGKRLHAVGQQPADAVLAMAWDRMGAKPGKKASYWVGKLSGQHKWMRQHVYADLATRSIVAPQEGRWLGIVPRTVYVSLQPDLEDAIRWRLCDAITYPNPARRAVCLASLVVGTQVEAEVFPKPLRRTARRVVRQWMKDDALGAAGKDTVAAVMVAIIAAVVASSVANSS